MKREHIVSVNQSLCIGCGLCRDDCPTMTIRMEEDVAVVTTQSCIKCGHCQAICPQGAVSLSGFDEAPELITPAMHVNADALLGQLKARRSVRRFTQREIAPETIRQIIEAGRYTPTGTNKQGVSYTVLMQNIANYEAVGIKLFRGLKRVIDLLYSGFRSIEIDDHFLFKNAKAVIVIKGADVVDGALAASSMELMAQSLGLGVFYSGFFAMITRFSGKLRRRLGIRRGEKAITTLVLGYPAVEYQRTAQRETANVLFD
ncbi:MAG: nitroreductase family protein [Eubacteriales bacterium]|jgi:nitroreductase/Pyruvate/2-oxoacid:ferredoxin oxidoreductase delta subunit|nr:nitroreductase family protein [Eubacteriales bacterium]